MSIEAKDIFAENIEVEFKELYNFICFIKDLIKSKKIFIKLFDFDNKKSAEVCLGPPAITLPDDHEIIFTSISSTYKKLCEFNLENTVIETQYIWNNLGRFNLFTIIGKKYDPVYILKFESKAIPKPDTNVVIFDSVIELNKTNFLTIVAFHGKIERESDNVLIGSFNKSELLGDFLFNSEDNCKKLKEIKSQYFKEHLIDRGFKVLD